MYFCLYWLLGCTSNIFLGFWEESEWENFSPSGQLSRQGIKNRFANWGWPIMILRRSQLVALLALPNSNMREEKMNSGLSCKIALCMQSLLGFRVPWAAFRFPKPRIPDSTSKTDIPDSRISIPRLTWGDKRSQRAKRQMVYYDETKQNGSKSTKHNLQTWPYLLGWFLHKSLIECFWHVRWVAS